MLVCVGGREKRSSSLFIHSLEWVWRKDMLFFSREIISQLREYVGKYVAFLATMFPSGWFFGFSSSSTNFLFLRHFFAFLPCSYFSMIFFWPPDGVYDARYVYLDYCEAEAPWISWIFYIQTPFSGSLFFLWLFSSDYLSIPRADFDRFL